MHEMGIAVEVMNIAMRHLPEGGRGLRVVAMRLKVGKLTAIIPETFKFCMQVATKDTPLEGADIVIEEVPLRVKCSDCGRNSELAEPPFICPECKSSKIEISSGRELTLESLEVEEYESSKEDA